MTLFKKIDKNTGEFIEDVLLDTRPILTEIVKTEITDKDGKTKTVEVTQNQVDEDGQVVYDPQYIETPVPQGFYLPKWNGTKWIEGGVPDKSVPEPNLEERIQILEETIIALTLI